MPMPSFINKTKVGNLLRFNDAVNARVLTNDGELVRIRWHLDPTRDLGSIRSYRPFQIERDRRWVVLDEDKDPEENDNCAETDTQTE